MDVQICTRYNEHNIMTAHLSHGHWHGLITLKNVKISKGPECLDTLDTASLLGASRCRVSHSKSKGNSSAPQDTIDFIYLLD